MGICGWMQYVRDATRTLRVDLQAAPPSVPQARALVRAMAREHGAGTQDQERIGLAVSEAVTNAVVHAYADISGSLVSLWAVAARDEIWVLVADDGCGLGAAAQSCGLGLGVPIMEHSCDALGIKRRAAGGTLVEMRFCLSARALTTSGLGSRAEEGSLAPEVGVTLMLCEPCC